MFSFDPMDVMSVKCCCLLFFSHFARLRKETHYCVSFVHFPQRLQTKSDVTAAAGKTNSARALPNFGALATSATTSEAIVKGAAMAKTAENDLMQKKVLRCRNASDTWSVKGRFL